VLLRSSTSIDVVLDPWLATSAASLPTPPPTVTTGQGECVLNAITKLRNDKVALGLRRHHINDRKAWRARLLSQEWLGLGAEGWFHEYEIRNRTVIGRASERTDHTQKHAIQWVELDNHSLFHNHTSGFHVRAGEKAWAQEAGRLDRIRTGVVEYILDQ